MSCVEVVTYKMGFGLDLLYLNAFTQFRTTGNTALLLFYTFQFTVAHTLGFCLHLPYPGNKFCLTVTSAHI
jgi:hypothetical protein